MKHLLQIVILALLVSSCSIARFQPVQRDSTVVRYIDSLRIRDSVVMVGIPMESSSQVTFPQDTSHLETSVARSDAWIDSEGRLHHTLNNKSDRKLPVVVPVIDRARAYDNIQHSVLTQIVEMEKPLTRWQEFRLKAFWWMAAIIAAGVAIQIARIYLH